MIFSVSGMLALGCRNSDEEVQQIDQIINLYIDSANIDMLNAKIEGAYTNVKMNDVYGLTDNAPVSFTMKKNQDTVNFIEYVAGAKRVLIDSSDVNEKIYESKISLIFTRKVNDSITSTFNDILTINYQWTPNVFQVSKVWYNNVPQFIKVQGEPNIVKISK